MKPNSRMDQNILVTPRDRNKSGRPTSDFDRQGLRDCTLSQSNKNPPRDSSAHSRKAIKTTQGSMEHDFGTLSTSKKQYGQANSNISSSQDVLMLCMRHPQRQAAYLMISDSNQATLYCEKCAIQLASRGFALKKLNDVIQTKNNYNSTAPSNNRRHSSQVKNTFKNTQNSDLQAFISNLDRVLDELVGKKQNSTLSLARLETEYGREIETANQYFNGLQILLEFQKNKYYNSILAAKKEAEVEIKRVSDLYENCIRQMRRILDNLSSRSLNSLNHSELEIILGEYSKKMCKYTQIVKSNTFLSRGPLFKTTRLRDLREIQGLFHQLIAVEEDEMPISQNSSNRLSQPFKTDHFQMSRTTERKSWASKEEALKNRQTMREQLENLMRNTPAVDHMGCQKKQMQVWSAAVSPKENGIQARPSEYFQEYESNLMELSQDMDDLQLK